MGLQLFLQRADDGTGELAVVGVGAPPDGGEAPILFALQMGVGATSDPADSGGYQITWTGAGAWTGMVIKNDPGQGIIWIAFLSLISGLVLSFYFPRRRVWARFAEGRLQLAMLADRYVDVNREFGALLDDVAARGGTRPLSGPAG